MRSVIVLAILFAVSALGGTLTDMQCDDDACSVNCQNFTFPTDVCIPADEDGESFFLHCLTPARQAYTDKSYNSSDCTGTLYKETYAVGQCVGPADGFYYEYFRDNSAQPLSKNAPKFRRAARKAKP